MFTFQTLYSGVQKQNPQPGAIVINSSRDMQSACSDYSKNVLHMDVKAFMSVMDRTFGPKIMDAARKAIREIKKLRNDYKEMKKEQPALKFSQMMEADFGAEAAGKISSFRKQLLSDETVQKQLCAIFGHGEKGKAAAMRHTGMLAVLTYFVSQDSETISSGSSDTLYREVLAKVFSAFSLWAGVCFSDTSSLGASQGAARGGAAGAKTAPRDNAEFYASLISDTRALQKEYDSKAGHGAYAELENAAGRMYYSCISPPLASGVKIRRRGARGKPTAGEKIYKTEFWANKQHDAEKEGKEQIARAEDGDKGKPVA